MQTRTSNKPLEAALPFVGRRKEAACLADFHAERKCALSPLEEPARRGSVLSNPFAMRWVTSTGGLAWFFPLKEKARE
jgi:hypothetical protein